jgi:psiF repeat
MVRQSRLSALLPALGLTLLTGGTIGLSGIAAADDNPPPATQPGNEASGRHHDPAWASCKKQADDKKLEPGDARKEFMRNCVKAAHASAPPAS